MYHSHHHYHVQGAFGAQRNQTAITGRQCYPAQAAQPMRSKSKMEQLVPIKMQHAAAQFVINYLANVGTGFYGEETEVGGEDDLRGVDFHLKNRARTVDIKVDFSLSSKGGFAVNLKPYWFEKKADGSYVFLAEYAQPLFRAFLPAMDPDNEYNLLRWKWEQKG